MRFISAFVGILGEGIIAGTKRIRMTFDFDRFGANILETHGAVLAFTNAVVDKGRIIDGAKRSAVIVKMAMSGSGITRIYWNTHSGKTEIIAQHGVSIVRVETGIAEESVIIPLKIGVNGEKVGQHRLKRSRVGDKSGEKSIVWYYFLAGFTKYFLVF